jgi:hypothetical protein
VRFGIAVVVPDDDVTGVHATVTGQRAPDGQDPRPVLIEAARASVNSLLEPLRALGGESTTAAMVSYLTCNVSGVEAARGASSVADAGSEPRTRAPTVP